MNNSSHSITLFNVGIGNYTPTETILFLAFVVALIVFSVISNSFVIYSIATYPPLKNPSNLFLLSLAVTDLLCGIFAMPLSGYYSLKGEWTLGSSGCRLWTFSCYYITSLSIFHLCAIAVDRYLAITRPLTYGLNRSCKKSVLVIALVWIGTFFIQSPPFAYDWADKWPKTYEKDVPCAIPQEYTHTYFAFACIFGFYIPLLIILAVYIRLYLANRARLKKKMEKSTNIIEMVAAASSSDCIENEPIRPDLLKQEEEMRANPTQGNLVADKQPKYSIVAGSKRRAKVPRETVAHLDMEVSDVCSKCQSRTDPRPPRSNDNEPNICKSCALPHNLVLAAEQSRLEVLIIKERRSMFVTALIVCAFLVSWLPGVTLFMILSVNPTLAVSSSTILLVTWLAYSNSACNPIIYTIFNKDFNDCFKDIMC